MYADLLRAFRQEDHKVYVISPVERRNNQQTHVVTEDHAQILKLRIGNTQKTNIIEKGISTLLIESQFVAGVKKYFSNIKFDLILYSTPPVTFARVIDFVKKRDGAESYLLLKDIFPQNAVDMGMMRKTGVKGFLYRFFRNKEKKLYALSDRIGCMSQANVAYLLKHNPQIDPAKVEVCPNSVEVVDMSVSGQIRRQLREKYGLPQDKTVFVYGGNLGRPQGIPFLVECLQTQLQNPDVYFLFVGDGTEYPKLEAWLAAHKPGNMKLLKRLPKEDYDRLVGACDVGMIFLDPRFTIPNFPSRLLSYMQAKLPVLCCTDPNTDVGSICVEGGFGWWCRSDEPAGFAALVQAVVTADLLAMGEKGYTYLQTHYSAEDGCKTILDGKK